MLLDCEPLPPLAELPVAELPVALLPVPVLPAPPLAELAPPAPRIRPLISTWLFAYLVRFSCCVPATRMYLSPLPLAEDPVPDVADPLVLDPVAEPVLDPEPLVPALLPPAIDDAPPLPILALVRTNCELLPEVLEPEPDADDPVAEPLPDVPVPDVPAVPAMSPVCRHPVTVTCCCVLELEPC